MTDYQLSTLSDLYNFKSIIDVRSPQEYTLDHIPGAINFPILNDNERHVVGLIHAKLSAFEAKKFGAVLAAKNVSSYLSKFSENPKKWYPLVYCWRGGLRSTAFISWMRFIGWNCRKLQGGYKSWRNLVRKCIPELCSQLKLHVLCGPTGCGKTYILNSLRSQGEQILDLEDLAKHRGSVFGDLPGEIRQPSQKRFETLLFKILNTFDRNRRVWIEAESQRIGRILVHDALLQKMKESKLFEISASLDLRLSCLLEDYSWQDSSVLVKKIEKLRNISNGKIIENWKKLASEKKLQALFKDLIQQYYDPFYSFSRKRNFKYFSLSDRVNLKSFSPMGIKKATEELISLSNLKSPGYSR